MLAPGDDPSITVFGAQDDDLDGLPEPTHLWTHRLEVGVDDHLEHVGFGAPAAVAEDAQEDRGLVLLTLEVDVQGTACLGLASPLAEASITVPVPVSPRDVCRRDLLGGLIHEYYRVAA